MLVLCHPRENGDPDPGFRRDDVIVIASAVIASAVIASAVIASEAKQSQEILPPDGFAWGLKAYFAQDDVVTLGMTRDCTSITVPVKSLGFLDEGGSKIVRFGRKLYGCHCEEGRMGFFTMFRTGSAI